MDSPERNRSRAKRDMEDRFDLKSDRARDNEEWEGSDKRKHRSGRSRKSGNEADVGGLDGKGRRRSHRDRSESRKRSAGSSNADSDEDYDLRNDSRAKLMKKKQEESSLEKLSSLYQDEKLDDRQDSGEKSGSRGLLRVEENERRKIASKLTQQESSQSKSKTREERSYDEEPQKTLDKDSKYLERKESIREKTHGSSERLKTSRRKWDESDGGKKAEESFHERSDSRSGKPSDPKYEASKEKSVSARNETCESKIRGVDSNGEKGTKFSNKEERKGDAEKDKSKSRGEILEEDNRGSPITREDRSDKEKAEKHRQKSSTARDAADGRDSSSNAEDDANAGMKDKFSREIENTTRSRTPEKTGRRYQDSEQFEMDNRSLNPKRKEPEKDGYRDERPKGKDDNWSDRNKDWEGPKENWKRRQSTSNDKDSKHGDITYDHSRDWELPRHGRERGDNERPHGRERGDNERHHGRYPNRKDGNRGEAVKTSSNFSNENYDVIEIQTKPIDYGRVESGSNFPRKNEFGQQSDGKSALNDEEWARRSVSYGSGPPREDSKERSVDDTISLRDQSSSREDFDSHGVKGRGQRGSVPGRSAGAQSSNGGSQPPYGIAEPGPLNRNPSQGVKGGRGGGRGGRGRLGGRDGQQVAIPLTIMNSPFGPIGMPPPGPMQPHNPSMSPAPGPPISPLFPFSPPVWPGARGIDINMLTIPSNLTSAPHGSSGPRFPPNMVTPGNPSMFFSQSGDGRGGPPNISPGFNPAGPMVRGTSADKIQSGWVPHKNSGPPGKAPSRGEQNDYSQNFVDTGMRPQNFIRELELTNVVEDYPKLRELIQKKDEIVAKAATHPMYYKCDLKEFELSPEFFGTKFDVILVDPPWEEYVHRAPGVADHTEYWTFEEIMNLKIEAIADTPSFIFLWVGDGMGLEQGRQCLKKWGFRRCEDICWVKTNKTNVTPGLRHDSHTLFQHSKEHCLMGIKGTVRRSTDGHIIHANIDTDVIIAEEPPYGSTQKPEDMYKIIEHFALGRRRLELFGEDHNIRSGWLTLGKGLSSSNFNAEGYIRNFADKDGKVWQGGGGRNPPPEAPHLVVTTPDIEALRPKSPMKNQQHQQSSSISLITANSSN